MIVAKNCATVVTPGRDVIKGMGYKILNGRAIVPTHTSPKVLKARFDPRFSTRFSIAICPLDLSCLSDVFVVRLKRITLAPTLSFSAYCGGNRRISAVFFLESKRIDENQRVVRHVAVEIEIPSTELDRIFADKSLQQGMVVACAVIVSPLPSFSLPVY